MFTPEFVSQERGEYILVANHSLETSQSVDLSIKYNRARILFSRQHLPQGLKVCRLVYDIRGQVVAASDLDRVVGSLSSMCQVEFKR